MSPFGWWVVWAAPIGPDSFARQTRSTLVTQPYDCGCTASTAHILLSSDLKKWRRNGA